MSDAVSAVRRDQPGGGPNRLCLFDVASGQAGYFTTEQARGCGYSRSLLSHHARSGGFIRISHGLYRLREYPSSPREHVLATWLAVGKDVAIVSHESALDLLELSDIIPDAVHLTVPRSRRGLPPVWGVKIHTTERPIGPGERWEREGITITSPARSILDAAETGADPDQIERAVVQAVGRGLATPDRLRRSAAERGRRAKALVDGALRSLAAYPIRRCGLTLEDLRARRDEILRVAAEHGARNVRVFGSVARGEAGATSDVDVLVDIVADVDGFAYFGLLEDLRRDLETLLECDVDVVDSAALREMRDRVLREAVPL